MKKYSLLILLSLGLCLLLGLPLQGQTPQVRTFEAFVATPEYAAAQTMLREGYQNEAVAAFLKLAEQHPSSTLGAHCLFQAASYQGSKEGGFALYQRILAEYPNSRFEIDAKVGLLAYGPQKTGEEWLAAMESLAVSYGAPTLAEVLRDPFQALAKFNSLPLEYRHGLHRYYEHMEIMLSRQARDEDLIKLCMFGKEAFAFDPGVSTYFMNGMNHSLFLLNGRQYGVSQNPQLRLLTKPNNLDGRRPRIRFESLLRGYSNPVNVARSTFSLDGVDVRSQMVTLRHILKPKPSKNGVFDKLRMAFQPSQPLAPGRHVFSALIRCDGNSGAATLTVNFTVNPERECDDRDDDDDWDRD